MEQVTAIFESLVSIAAAGLILSEVAQKLGWLLEGVLSQVRAIVLTMILSTVGCVLNLGMYADPITCGGQAWYVCGPVIGLVAGLGANFVFMTPIGKVILEFLKLRPKEAPPTPPTPPTP